MPEEKEASAIEKRNVLVGIQIDSYSRELLSWALVKVAEPGDSVIAVQVFRSSGDFVNRKSLLDSYLEVYGALCSLKKVELTGQMWTGRSLRKTLVKEAKNHSAVAVVVGINNQNAIRRSASTAKYCAKRLPPTTDVLAIHNGKILYRSCNNNRLPGLYDDPRPSFCLIDPATSKETQSGFDESDANTEISSFDVLTRSGSKGSRDSFLSRVCGRKKRFSSFTQDVLDQKQGLPLLRKASSAAAQIMQSRELPVVQWIMSRQNRSPQLSPQSSITENLSEGERSGILEQSSSISSSALGALENDFEILLNAKSSSCKWFGYKVLEAATNRFCSGNMIGKGGCNHVYKGLLQDGKPVAIKIQKSSREARKDFGREVNIVSSLNHKHITPLLGICIEDAELISVYDFFSRGSLEENLRGDDKDKSPLSWQVRFSISVKMAEALNYLHNECSRPVIHRDVKSSNILLSDSFEPQLSDFGLAIWGPTTCSFLTQGDVVGTFGYLAPEYFMYGNLSEKVDVYAFGVVLLELLSGRKPVASETPKAKGQESLVMWAKPLIESGNVRGILDPNLDGNVDDIQMQRMVLAAALCISRSARLRPNMSQILKLLRGDNDGENLRIPKNKDQEDAENQVETDDDEVYPNCSAELHLSLALLGVNDDSMSHSSSEQGNNIPYLVCAGPTLRHKLKTNQPVQRYVFCPQKGVKSKTGGPDKNSKSLLLRCEAPSHFPSHITLQSESPS